MDSTKATASNATEISLSVNPKNPDRSNPKKESAPKQPNLKAKAADLAKASQMILTQCSRAAFSPMYTARIPFHGGDCYLRFDDRNPTGEEEKYFVAIEEMINWLGFKAVKVTHSSDNFDRPYELAEELINRDGAYVCHCTSTAARARTVCRRYLEVTVPRLMLVLDPIPVVIENIPEDYIEMVELPFSKDPAFGVHTVPFTRTVYIERSDFRE
ncbi:hypothetical protein V496_08279 [Pseudogymnoascus sp. VKM F-4515 (FW-2607)]|nr:hypothetical protein V496_08279 [Pseudogymnoascus sp. VKM F-4515 (FW-2607)]KFY95899.1 hypothetical protein V498_03042 [Pseudogymnoascus sp. VKM F-4517 (FW-2822)]